MLLFAHYRLSAASAIFTGIMALWAMVEFVRARPIGGNYMGAVVVGEGLLLAEGAVGVLLLLSTPHAELRWVHLLYGVLALLIWPFLFTYTRGVGERREALMYAAGTFFLWGMVMRAAFTAHLALP